MNSIPEFDRDDAAASIRALRAAKIHGLTRDELTVRLPELGMNDEEIHEMPAELERYFGRGLRFWQYPHQLAGLLCLLKDRPGGSYLEIGSRWGGTFVLIDHWLRAFDHGLKSYAIDLLPQPKLIEEYSREADCTDIQGDSGDVETWSALPDRIDIVLIDGFHSWEAVRRDFQMAMKLYPHTIILHDTASDACPGVRLFWQDLRRVFPDTVEFHEQYPSVKGSYLGIGVVCL